MGDTYNCIEILVSNTEKIFSLWDRGQLIVILSRTRIIKDNIFVGKNNETICVLNLMLNQRTQWCDYIKEVKRSQILNQIKILNLQLLWINPDFHFEFVIYNYHKIKLGLFILLCHKNITFMTTLYQWRVWEILLGSIIRVDTHKVLI